MIGEACQVARTLLPAGLLCKPEEMVNVNFLGQRHDFLQNRQQCVFIGGFGHFSAGIKRL